MTWPSQFPHFWLKHRVVGGAARYESKHLRKTQWWVAYHMFSLGPGDSEVLRRSTS